MTEKPTLPGQLSVVTTLKGYLNAQPLKSWDNLENEKCSKNSLGFRHLQSFQLLESNMSKS